MNFIEQIVKVKVCCLLASAFLLNTNCSAQFFTEKPGNLLSIRGFATGINMDKNDFIWIYSQNGLYRYDGESIKLYNEQNCAQIRSVRLCGVNGIYPALKNDWLFIDANLNIYGIDKDSKVIGLTDFAHKFYCNVKLFRFLVFKPEVYDKYIPDLENATDIWTAGKDKFVYVRDSTLWLCTRKHSQALIAHLETVAYNSQSATVIAITSKGAATFSMTEARLHYSKIYGAIHLSGADIRNARLLSGFPNRTPLLWYNKSIYELTVHQDTILTTLLSVSNENQPPELVYYNREKQLMLQYFPWVGFRTYDYCQYALITTGMLPGSNEYYYAILPYGNGFIGITQHAVYKADLSTKHIEPIISGNFNPYFFCKDAHGRVWYNDEQKKRLSYLLPATGAVSNLDSLPHYNRLSAVIELPDSNEIVFVCTHKIFTHPANDLSGAGRIIYTNAESAPSIHAALLYNRNTMWLGLSKGLLQLDLHTGQYTRPPELGNAEIKTFFKVDDSTVLIGTYNYGVVCYKAGRFHFLDSVCSTPIQSANGFVCDKAGYLWISSNYGLFKIKLDDIRRCNSTGRQKIQVLHFADFSHVASNEFNGSNGVSAVAISDSCLAFANAKGIVLINPFSYKLPAATGRILVESGGKQLDTIKAKSGIPIALTPVVPYYGNRENFFLSYRLDDQDWQVLQKTGDIIYSDLKPGTHQLTFSTTTSGMTPAHQSGREITILIQPRWYQTSLFKVILANIAVIVLLIMLRLRGHYLYARNKKLKEIVAEKTKETQQMIRELNETVLMLKKSEQELEESNNLKEQYYSLLSHDLRTPVKFLQLSIGQLTNNLDQYSPDAVSRQLKAFYNSATEVHNLVSTFLNWIRSSDESLKVKRSEVFIKTLLTDIMRLYDPVTLQNIKLSVVVDDTLSFYIDRNLLHIIVRNAVDNALKHANATRVTIYADYSPEGNLLISVCNDGKEIPADSLAFLNNMRGDAAVKWEFNKRVSMGFQTIAMLTEKLNGAYTLESSSGHGTKLKFVFNNQGYE